METPDYNHIFKNEIYREKVYEPSEDTFILLDAIEKDIDSIRGAGLVLEVGCGNGVPGTFLKKALGKDCFLLSTDIN